MKTTTAQPIGGLEKEKDGTWTAYHRGVVLARYVTYAEARKAYDQNMIKATSNAVRFLTERK